MNVKLYLAPLQGFTDYPFRNSYSKFFSGFDIAMAPFISALPGGRYKKKEVRDVMPENNHGLPVIPQIMGNNPDDFAAVANLLYDLGYQSVNWNLGCPYKMVAKKKRGSGLLCYPDDIRAFLDRVFPLMKTGLSVKMRLGRHSEEEIFTLMPIFDGYPLDEIIIHPRTGVQMYNGSVNLDCFEKALGMTKHRVVYNGDIRDPDSFKKTDEKFTNIDRWMIGRGVLSDPFLPVTIKQSYGISDESAETNKAALNKTEIIKKFHEDYYLERLEYLQGPAHITDRMKSFWSYLAGSFKTGDKFFKKLKKTRAPEQYNSVVAQFFDSDPEWIVV